MVSREAVRPLVPSSRGAEAAAMASASASGDPRSGLPVKPRGRSASASTLPSSFRARLASTLPPGGGHATSRRSATATPATPAVAAGPTASAAVNAAAANSAAATAVAARPIEPIAWTAPLPYGLRACIAEYLALPGEHPEVFTFWHDESYAARCAHVVFALVANRPLADTALLLMCELVAGGPVGAATSARRSRTFAIQRHCRDVRVGAHPVGEYGCQFPPIPNASHTFGHRFCSLSDAKGGKLWRYHPSFFRDCLLRWPHLARIYQFGRAHEDRIRQALPPRPILYPDRWPRGQRAARASPTARPSAVYYDAPAVPAPPAPARLPVYPVALREDDEVHQDDPAAWPWAAMAALPALLAAAAIPATTPSRRAAALTGAGASPATTAPTVAVAATAAVEAAAAAAVAGPHLVRMYDALESVREVVAWIRTEPVLPSIPAATANVADAPTLAAWQREALRAKAFEHVLNGMDRLAVQYRENMHPVAGPHSARGGAAAAVAAAAVFCAGHAAPHDGAVPGAVLALVSDPRDMPARPRDRRGTIVCTIVSAVAGAAPHDHDRLGPSRAATSAVRPDGPDDGERRRDGIPPGSRRRADDRLCCPRLAGQDARRLPRSSLSLQPRGALGELAARDGGDSSNGGRCQPRGSCPARCTGRLHDRRRPVQPVYRETLGDAQSRASHLLECRPEPAVVEHGGHRAAPWVDARCRRLEPRSRATVRDAVRDSPHPGVRPARSPRVPCYCRSRICARRDRRRRREPSATCIAGPTRVA
ncbi:hypothetical protein CAUPRSCDRAFT_11120 [Caulochytrium protostelioides]|uniref:Uncharacterized protein n=1 Tax=Caulochytrium protostelioides TaxID=1555241 RepID=A0A4P9WY43_9FUNG|nr:hypothetical protein CAUPRSCDRAFT_11120 [Caulochytrium protostelioides]